MKVVLRRCLVAAAAALEAVGLFRLPMALYERAASDYSKGGK